MWSPVFLLPGLFSVAWGCPKHDNHLSHPHLGPRQTRVDTGRTLHDWGYAQSFDWATIKPDYSTCEAGTHQSPINIPSGSISTVHIPDFGGYLNASIPGNFFNWGFAPAWTPHYPTGDLTGLPSFTFDGQQVYLNGWHMHTPAEHLVDGERERAELHLVHANSSNVVVAVIGIRLVVGRQESAFVGQLGSLINYNDTTQIEGLPVNTRLAIDEVDELNEFWTYQGSLTTPPCTENVRWFLPTKELVVSESQMVQILGASRFSHRVLQKIWLHDING